MAKIIIYGGKEGYVSLYNSAIFLEEIKIRSETYGSGIDVALDFKLNDNVAIGFGVSLIGMNFSTVQYDYAGISKTIKLDGNSRENFSRLDLSIALKWYHNKK